MKKYLLGIVFALLATCCAFATGKADAPLKGKYKYKSLAGSAATTAPDFGMKGFATVSGEGYTTTTGGAGGSTITIRTLAELEAWAATRENNTTPQIVYISGKITSSSSTIVTIKRGANLSVLGLGSNAELENVGLNFREYNNLIVRNLKIHEVFYPNDALTIDECKHVWVDHNEFHSKIGAGIGVDTYDGLLDIKKGSRYVTISWNYFHDHMKNVLIGHTDNAGAEAEDRQIRVTFHHNFFENTDGRNPSLRWGAVHFYNNYLKNITDYGFAVRQGAHAKIENNVYENVKTPISTNKFDGEGYACVSGNLFIGTSGNSSITQTDCDWWNATTLPYTYTLDDVNDITTIVPANVGTGKISITGDNQTITYQLTTAVVGEGSLSTTGGVYDEGEVVAITATPATGWVFNGWSGAATGTANPVNITMDNNKTLTATFVAEGAGGDNGSNPTVQIKATDAATVGMCSFDGSLRTTGTGGDVINLPNTAGKGINWKVEAPVAGTYTLKWSYAGGGSAATEAAKVLINGTTALENVSFPKPKDSKTYLVTEPVSVQLEKGVNEIRLEVIQSLAFADIEWIEVTGESTMVTDCANPVGYSSVVASSDKDAAKQNSNVKALPNPAKDNVIFEVNQAKAGKVKISLYNVNGGKVAVVADQHFNTGLSKIAYKTSGLKAGVYVYTVESGAGVVRGKLVIK
ncbi:T9SS type A sorting domain-containing protein [uncultured Pontibacter sp.]|uniref:pectate lyase family protein n=1 Tax=uncultured Pontibacter sp. TaxID=453356 RepID=UPI002635A231|nr:T9SS type A sorting domain-containing protein [uncultured Pontibacter sp.]